MWPADDITLLLNQLQLVEYKQSQLITAVEHLKLRVAALEAEPKSDALRPGWSDLQRLAAEVEDLRRSVNKERATHSSKSNSS